MYTYYLQEPYEWVNATLPPHIGLGIESLLKSARGQRSVAKISVALLLCARYHSGEVNEPKRDAFAC